MITIIAGGRDYHNYAKVLEAIKESGFNITKVISGGATGVDALGVQWAKSLGIDFEIMPANWNDLNHPKALIKVNQSGKQYNAAAGPIRNEEMARVAEALIAIDTGGPGTRSMIKLAKQYNLKVFILKI